MNKSYKKLTNITLGLCLFGISNSWGQVVETFDYTGGMQTFVVPDGVTEIEIEVLGAEGGDVVGTTVGWGGTADIDVDAGDGGRVIGLLAVTPGETLNLFVGGEGSMTSGGYNGGGNSAEPCGGTEVIAAGGGGASDIRQGGMSLADRIVVSGGGGGVAGNGSADYKSTAGSGAGGGLIGQDAGIEDGGIDCLLGTGGGTSSGGIGGNNSCWCTLDLVAGEGVLGVGGTSVCAPSGLSVCTCTGTGCTSGGGGGGGYYGGGAGICYAGGGGGSSYTGDGVTGVTHTQGYNEGNGQIILTYCLPITITVVATDEMIGGDGTIEITVIGGVSPYTFDWDIDGTGDFDDAEDLTDLDEGTYTVVVKDNVNCSVAKVIEIGNQVGIEEFENSILTVYPNPISDLLNIKVEGEFEYEVVDVNGEVLLKGKSIDLEILSLKNYAVGVYLVNVKTTNVVESIKFIKE